MHNVRHLQPVALASEWAESAHMLSGLPGAPDSPTGMHWSNEERYAALTAEMLRRGYIAVPDGKIRLNLPRFRLRGKPPVILAPLCGTGALISPLIGWGAFDDSSAGAWVGTTVLILSVAASVLLAWLAVRLSFVGLRVDRHGILISKTFSRTLVKWTNLLDITYKPIYDANSLLVCGWIYVFVTSHGKVLVQQPEYAGKGRPSSAMERHRLLLVALRDANDACL